MTDPRFPVPERLLIVGIGGLGRETLWLAREAGVREIAFLDDRHNGGDESVDGAPIVGRVAEWPSFASAIVIAVGAPRVRRKIVDDLARYGSPDFATLLHPSVKVGHNVAVGAGSIVAAGSTLSCDIVIGAHAVVGLHCVISHDCRFGDFVSFAPGVTIPGSVTGGSGCEVALNATMRQGTRLGQGSLVGMGSVVTHDVADNMLCFGAPARPVRSLSAFESLS